MHGLIFVTWEKFLAERFGSGLLNDYRNAIGETAASADVVPLRLASSGPTPT